MLLSARLKGGCGRDRPPMKFWQAGVLVALVIVGYFVFGALSSSKGLLSLGVANVAGLGVVILGVVAAGLMFRRATPQR